MSISTIRRQVKNVAYNFSDAQVKVREATSNDPWGPSTALMSEIADLTNNQMAFTEIMSIVWKRLNDSGKNWRHVYKSLVLLDFLIKCGNEKVAQQCRENIFTIETLKDFQHIEENRDQGLSIREKAKMITGLLTDDERLKNERTRFMLTRNKFKQGGSSQTEHRIRRSETGGSTLDSEFEDARPSSVGEEEMQLQLAIALSKEEHEKTNEMKKSDEVRLQLAIEESKKEAEKFANAQQGTVSSGQLTQSALDDLLSLGVGEMVSSGALVDPWGAPAVAAASSHQTHSAWDSHSVSMMGNNDPWASSSSMPIQAAPIQPMSTADPFSAWEQQQEVPLTNNDLLGGLNTNSSSSLTNGSRKTPENFLGENSSLVNLDNLLGGSNSSAAPANPFLLTSNAATTNPFAAQQRKSPTLNEMRAAQGQAPPIPQAGPRTVGLPQPLQPTQANPFANPF